MVRLMGGWMAGQLGVWLAGYTGGQVAGRLADIVEWSRWSAGRDEFPGSVSQFSCLPNIQCISSLVKQVSFVIHSFIINIFISCLTYFIHYCSEINS